MKKGTYVSRATFQKVSQENKKLRQDIFILTQAGMPSFEKIELAKTWRDKFAADKAMQDSIYELIVTARKEMQATCKHDKGYVTNTSGGSYCVTCGKPWV